MRCSDLCVGGYKVFLIAERSHGIRSPTFRCSRSNIIFVPAYGEIWDASGELDIRSVEVTHSTTAHGELKTNSPHQYG